MLRSIGASGSRWMSLNWRLVSIVMSAPRGTINVSIQPPLLSPGPLVRPGRLHLRLPEVGHLNLRRTGPGEGRVIRDDRLRPARR